MQMGEKKPNLLLREEITTKKQPTEKVVKFGFFQRVNEQK